MFLKNIIFFILESWKGLFRNGWMSIASVGVVAITLFILSVFVLLNHNVRHWSGIIKDEVEIVVYVDDEATLEERRQLRRKLDEYPEVDTVNLVTKEEALERLRDQMGDSGILEGYDNPRENPLRDSYEVRAGIPEQVPRLAEEMQGFPAVGSIRYGEEIVERLFSFTRVLQLAVMGLMVALAVTATFLISHTIRLTVLLRKREIMIMKYVGATDWFIRWPFVLEGFNLGLLGTVIPLVAVYYGYQEVVLWMEANLNFLPPLLPLQEAMWETSILVIPLGLTLGVMGSMISIGRFLRV